MDEKSRVKNRSITLCILRRVKVLAWRHITHVMAVIRPDAIVTSFGHPSVNDAIIASGIARIGRAEGRFVYWFEAHLR